MPHVSVLHPVPNVLEYVIRYRRRCVVGCPMVKTLDQRIENQRKLVSALLKQRGLTIDEIEQIAPQELDKYDALVQLCYHVLRDCEYIDGLR